MSAGGEAKAFISYSRQDLAFVDRLDAALRDRGVETLIDRSAIEIGEKWFERLKDLISRAETVVFVISPDSIASRICADEVQYGKCLAKRFIPVVARRIEEDSAPETLSELNYLFLDDDDTYEIEVDHLARAIKTDLVWMRQHADLGRLAEEWATAARPRGLLLASSRLTAAELWISSRPANAPLPTENARGLIAASRSAARQRRNALFGTLLIGIVTALALAVYAYQQRDEALVQRTEAVSQRLQAEYHGQLAKQREIEAQEQRDIARRNFETAKTTLDTVIFDLARGLRTVEGIRLSVLRTVLSRAEVAMDQLAQASPGDPEVQRSKIVMLQEFGSTYFAAGDSGEALKSYEQSINLSRQLLLHNPEDQKRQDDLATALTFVVEVKIRSGNHPGALASCLEAVEIRRSLLIRDPRNAKRLRDLSVTVDGIGDLKERAGDPDGALQAYQEALELRRTAVNLEPNRPRRHDISVSLENIGRLKRRTRDIQGALSAYLEALELRRALARDEPDNSLWQQDLSISLGAVGSLKIEMDEGEDALVQFEESLLIMRSLVRRDPDNMEWRYGLVAALERTGNAKRHLKTLPEALAFYEEGLSIARDLRRQAPNDLLKIRTILVLLDRIGNLKVQLEDSQGAVALFEEALTITRDLVKRSPSSVQSHQDLGTMLIRVGVIKYNIGYHQEARALLEEGLQTARSLSLRDPNNVHWLTEYVQALYRNAILGSNGDQSVILLREALSIVERLETNGQLSATNSHWPQLIRSALSKYGRATTP